MEERGDLGRRELIEPVLIPGGFELTLLDRNVQDKARDAIDQSGNDAHLCDGSCPTERHNRRLSEDGLVVLEGAVGALGRGAESVQLVITLGASGDFQDKPGMLGDGDVSRKAEAIAAMRTIPVEIEIGRKTGLEALLEAGEGEPFRHRVEAVRPAEEMAVRDIGPTVTIVTSFEERFTG